MVAPNGNQYDLSVEQLEELKRLAELHGMSFHDFFNKLLKDAERRLEEEPGNELDKEQDDE